MASKLYRNPDISPASPRMVAQISDQLGLQIPEDEYQDYVDLVNEVLSAASVINDIPQPKPEVAFPRTPGYRPQGKDNPYNAWYMKTEIKGAPSGVLAGKRIAIKDNVAVAGVPMMNGSSLLEGHVPDYDATVVTRILKAGGTITGKAVCENLCYDGSSFSPATGPVLNPVASNRSAGGSSSGSAALVAAGEVDMALGGDQAGSIRLPSSWCGIVGLKPTFGLVPYTGAMGLYPPIDHLGPMARTVGDCAAFLQAIAGPDPFDPRQKTAFEVPDYLAELEKDVVGLKLGILKEGFEACTDEEVQSVVTAAVEKLVTAGSDAFDISIPAHSLLGGPLFGHLVYPGSAALIKNGGVLPGVGGWHDVAVATRMKQALKTQARNLSCTLKLAFVVHEVLKKNDDLTTFTKAENLIPMLRKAYDDALEECDVLIMPTTPYPAPELPKSDIKHTKDLINHGVGMVANTASFDLTGHPALTINAGHTKEEKLPVGMMIIGRHFDEATLFRVARAFEKVTET